MPGCELLKTVEACDKLLPYELEQVAYRSQNCLNFLFCDPQFFDGIIDRTQEQSPEDVRYRQLLKVKFIEGKSEQDFQLETEVDDKFDNSLNHRKHFMMLEDGRVLSLLENGDMTIHYQNEPEKTLTIPAMTGLIDEDLSHADEPQMDWNVSENGMEEKVYRFAHYSTPGLGRTIEGFNIIKKNCKYDKLFIVNIDQMGILTKIPRTLRIEVCQRFILVADKAQIAIWNAKDGGFINHFGIPDHYDPDLYSNCLADKWSNKGLDCFCLIPGGLLIVHNGQKFPIAADVMAFW